MSCDIESNDGSSIGMTASIKPSDIMTESDADALDQGLEFKDQTFEKDLAKVAEEHKNSPDPWIIRVESCSNLPAAPSSRKPSPCVKIRLGKIKDATDIKQDTCDPEYNRAFIVHDWQSDEKLKVTVVDKASNKNVFIGEVSLSKPQQDPRGYIIKDYRLESKKASEIQHGTVLITLINYEQKSRKNLIDKECSGLHTNIKKIQVERTRYEARNKILEGQVKELKKITEQGLEQKLEESNQRAQKLKHILSVLSAAKEEKSKLKVKLAQSADKIAALQKEQNDLTEKLAVSSGGSSEDAERAMQKLKAQQHNLQSKYDTVYQKASKFKVLYTQEQDKRRASTIKMKALEEQLTFLNDEGTTEVDITKKLGEALLKEADLKIELEALKVKEAETTKVTDSYALLKEKAQKLAGEREAMEEKMAAQRKESEELKKQYEGELKAKEDLVKKLQGLGEVNDGKKKAIEGGMCSTMCPVQ